MPVPALDEPLNFGEAFVQYLNGGGSFERLVEQAGRLGLLASRQEREASAQPDLNGDGHPEPVLSLVDWLAPESPGKLYVAKCEGGAYRLIYTTPDSRDYPRATIVAAFDQSGDGWDDLLISREGCGAHTCFAVVEVLMWYQDALQNRLDDYYLDLPSPTIQVFGPMMDGSYQVVVTGNGVASIGAGPFHKRAVTWGWNPDTHTFRMVDYRFLPSNYRIHIVHEGDRSFALGNYAAALDYYNRVIHDSTLEDWPVYEGDPDLAPRRRQELAAYARFRRILVRLKLGDPASAEVHYQDLIDRHPPGAPGAGFAQMGRVFWEKFTSSGDLEAACAAAQRYAAANPAEVLDPLEYGYSNPTYSPAGLCPTAP